MAILGKSLTNRVSHSLPLDVGSNPKIVSYERLYIPWNIARNCCYIFGIYMILLLWHHCSKNNVTVSYISQLFLQKDSETPHFRTTLNTSSHPLPILFPSHPFLFPCHRRRWAWACPNAAPGGARTSEKDPGRRDSGFLPPNGLLKENPLKIDDLGYPYFLETSIYIICVPSIVNVSLWNINERRPNVSDLIACILLISIYW